MPDFALSKDCTQRLVASRDLSDREALQCGVLGLHKPWVHSCCCSTQSLVELLLHMGGLFSPSIQFHRMDK